MLINKKFLALALLPMFSACVVNDPDDDVAGTDTETSATMTTTDPTATTATTASTTTDTTTTATTASTSDTEPDTDTDTADTSVTDTDTTDTDTGGDAGYCVPSCEEAIDCCAGEPTCEAGVGTFPYAWSCDEGACTFGGCTADDECTFGGVIPANVCDEDSGACGYGCTDTAECQAVIGMETFECNGVYCEPAPCADDADCTAPATCDVDSGLCLGPGCATDADCEVIGGICDAETGFCGCTADKECGEGSACVTG